MRIGVHGGLQRYDGFAEFFPKHEDAPQVGLRFGDGELLPLLPLRVRESGVGLFGCLCVLDGEIQILLGLGELFVLVQIIFARVLNDGLADEQRGLVALGIGRHALLCINLRAVVVALGVIGLGFEQQRDALEFAYR